MKIHFNFLSLLCFVLSFSSVTLAQVNHDMKQLDKQGHRGCRGILPENTIQGCIKAIDLGVNTLEMDVVISKDNQVLLSHEPFFNHEITTLPNGEFVSESEEKNHNIYSMLYSEIEKYDVGLKPHPRFPSQLKIKAHKPLLLDVIDSVEAYTKTKNKAAVYYNIETKTTRETDVLFHPEPKAFVDLLMAIIYQKGIQKRVIIQSFDVRTLQYLHQKDPAIQTALLVEAYDANDFSNQIKNLGFIPTIYSPAQELVNLKLVQECHSKNVKLIPWTVNDSKTIREFVAMGVDGIITDYPNLFEVK